MLRLWSGKQEGTSNGKKVIATAMQFDLYCTVGYTIMYTICNLYTIWNVLKLGKPKKIVFLDIKIGILKVWLV